MQVAGFQDKVSFIWSVADLLRGVILPFTVLRRLECALAPSKKDVIKKAKSLEGKVQPVEKILQKTAGHSFYNISALELRTILQDDKNEAANLRTYIRDLPLGGKGARAVRPRRENRTSRQGRPALPGGGQVRRARPVGEGSPERRDGLHLRGAVAQVLRDEQRHRG